jgi:G3E family GTPase
VNRIPVRVVAGPLPEPRAGWVALKPHNCPCCVGRVELQVELARVIREQRPQGVLIELADASHQPALLRALAEWPLAQYVRLEPPA